jgi:hypothetical protein
VRAPEATAAPARDPHAQGAAAVVKTFATVEALRLALIAWAELYNREC